MCIILLSIGTTADSQDSTQAVFNRANTLLQKGQYREALNTYDQIRSGNVSAGPLFLNMAITYTRLDSLGNAKYYFLKAREYSATAREAQKGLQYVESQLQQHPAVLPKLPWRKVIDWLQANIGYAGLFIIGGLLLNLGVAGVVLSWFSKQRVKWWSAIGRTAGGIGLIFILLSGYINYLENRYTRAVMISETTALRKSPGASDDIVSKVHEGYTFTVDRYRSEQTDSPWLYVTMKNGQKGWINQKNLKIL